MVKRGHKARRRLQDSVATTTTTGASTTEPCGESYVSVAGDTCDTVMATTDLNNFELWQNNPTIDCNTKIPSGTEIQMGCYLGCMKYKVLTGDTCDTVAKGE